jgi:hypothetical protein
LCAWNESVAFGRDVTHSFTPMKFPMLLPSFILLTALFSTTFAYNNTVYLIRHAEKPKHGNGLSHAGQQRAECLVDVP